MSVFTSYNPVNGEIIGTYPVMEKSVWQKRIANASVAQCAWSRTRFEERKTRLQALARTLRAELETYAKLMTTEMGKPITQARAEIEKCAILCDYYAEAGEAFLQPELIKTHWQKSYRLYQPLGVLFGIMPWNFPFWQVMRFAIPNLMLGNAVLFKHAPNVMGVAKAMESLALSSGLPEGLFASLGIDVVAVPEVIAHPEIRGVSLTGSCRAGRSVASLAGQSLKKVVLELGGSDPYIILEDADLDLAAKQCVLSRMSNAGQVCIAAKRLIVMASCYEAFVKKVLHYVSEYQCADPILESTLLGPMAREDLRQALHAQVETMQKQGAHCVLGGQIPSGPGYYYPATVLLDVSPAMLETEVFGPVVCISKVATEDDAFELANASPYGLAGAVFTQDTARGEMLARTRLQAGTCAVNTFVASDPRLPFGGIKQSGFGRELSREGIHEFANIKTVVIA